ncbi:MAG: hemolysin III family protein [Saprospiraceae bacterium]|nr:hemolysin III family protein [Saprospiraceae bacterium]
MKQPHRLQTREEERLNTLTHGLGVAFALFATPFLIKQATDYGTPYALATVSVFGLGMFVTYLSSTVYHAVKNPRQKHLWHVCDHICIFLLIGGTYTPVIFRYLPFDQAMLFMATMWGIILLGIVFKLFFTGKLEWLSLSLYVFLGWMLLFVAKPLSQTMSADVLSWILYGSFAYMVGIVFYKWRSRKYTHAIWHCCTLLGTMAHFIAVYLAFSC